MSLLIICYYREEKWKELKFLYNNENLFEKLEV